MTNAAKKIRELESMAFGNGVIFGFILGFAGGFFVAVLLR